MTKRVVIAPGHGGRDVGAVGHNIQEKRITWDIATKLVDILKAAFDVEVFLIQPSTIDPNVDARQDLYKTINEANRLHKEKPIDLYVSIHVNSNAGKPGAGFESYVYSAAANSKTDELRNVMHDQIMALLKKYNIIDRGKKYANYAELRDTYMPAVLFENLFINNPKEAKLLADPKVIQQLANEYAYAIFKALNLTRK